MDTVLISNWCDVVVDLYFVLITAHIFHFFGLCTVCVVPCWPFPVPPPHLWLSTNHPWVLPSHHPHLLQYFVNNTSSLKITQSLQNCYPCLRMELTWASGENRGFTPLSQPPTLTAPPLPYQNLFFNLTCLFVSTFNIYLQPYIIMLLLIGVRAGDK